MAQHTLKSNGINKDHSNFWFLILNEEGKIKGQNIPQKGEFSKSKLQLPMSFIHFIKVYH